MSTLVEVAEFVEAILRLDIDTPVKGYDGTDIGPANEQAQALANRTLWLKEGLQSALKEINEISGKAYVSSINEKTGDVTITYSDIGAAAAEHKHSPSDIETTEDAEFVSEAEKKTWSGKQDKLVSGETIKTLLGVTLLGEGNITIKSADITVDDDNQFVSKTEKETWNAKQDALKSGENVKTLHGQSLVGSGNVTLGYEDVGAEKAGAAQSAVDAHVSQADPHQQYLTKESASETYVQQSKANKPLGYLQLDENGYLPEDIAKLYEAHYYIAETEADRLKIEKNKNIVICLQTDENKIFYLNPNTDPSVTDNWLKGGDNVINNVTSVFGRSGVVEARTGDYNADQITETDDRTFVSSEDRTNWNKKQEVLVSGENIKSINGESLLGGTDIQITPTSIGAAEKEHKHPASDIEVDDDNQFVSENEKENWSSKQDQLFSGETIATVFGKDLLKDKAVTIRDAAEFSDYLSEVLKGEGGVTITLSEDKKSVSITSNPRNINIFAVNNAKPDTVYSYAGDEDNFDFTSYVLKEVLLSGEQDFRINYSGQLASLPRTAEPSFDDDGYIPSTISNGVANLKWKTDTYVYENYTPPAAAKYVVMNVAKSYQKLVPVLNSTSGVDDFVAIASNFRARYEPYHAFQDEMSSSESASVAAYTYWSDVTIWNSKDGDVWFGVDCGTKREVNAYGFQYFKKFYYGTSTPPTGWFFEGCDTIDGLWETIDIQLNQTLISTTSGWNQYVLDKVVNYRYYRLRIVSVANTSGYTSIPRFQLYTNNHVLLKSNDSKYYTVDSNAQLKAVSASAKNLYKDNGFASTGAVDISALSAISPITICSDQSSTVNLYYKGSSPQAVLHHPLRDISVWDNLEHIFADYYNTDVDKANIYWVATTNGTEFFTISADASEWTSVGTLALTADGANTVIQKGRALTDLNTITKEQWAALLSSGGDKTRLGLLYATVIGKKTDALTPKTLQGKFEEITTWVKTEPGEVTITIKGDQIQFTPSNQGNYKFCYYFYG